MARRGGKYSVKEVKDIYQYLKNKKVRGPGNVPAELLKHGCNHLFEQLTKKKNATITKAHTEYTRKFLELEWI